VTARARARALPRFDAEPEPPSATLPLAFFAAALLWLAGGSAGLLATVPDLSLGVYQTPRVVAVTHAFTLGVLASAIFGALHQFVPAVMGVPIRHPRIAWWGFWLTETGVALLIWSLWRWRPVVQAAAWAVLLLGVGFASVNTVPGRRRAVRNRRVGLYISLGHSALGLGMLLALVRIGDGLGWWHTPREALLAAHFHLGAVGFGTLTAMGMASRMLPAFLGVEDTRDGALDWLGWAVSAALVLYTGGLLLAARPVVLAGGAALAGCLLLHLGIVAGYFRHRTHRRWDPGTGFLAVAAVFYGLAIVAGLRVLFLAPRAGSAWTAYVVLAVAGWLVTLILGVMHRVAPRIAVQARQRRGLGLTGAQRGARGLPRAPGWAALVAWAPGVALLAAAAYGALPGAARPGTALMGLGAALVLGEALVLARHLVRER
jgi:hypothetical protein